MKKLNIAVFFGGCSSEYSVSLESAYSVIRNLNKEKYCPVLIGISNDGGWFYFTGDIEKIRLDTWKNNKDCIPAVLSPNRRKHELFLLKKNGFDSIRIDAAFPVLHGKNGEDGTVQGLVQLADIPLAGCGTLASALCMDKDRAHKLAGLAGVRVPKAMVLETGTSRQSIKDFAIKIGYPLYVKPVKAGSSYGVTKVLEPDALMGAVDLAFQYDNQVIMEENIDGFEVGCAVLGNEQPITGEVDEIELADGFFDFTEKYTLKTSAIHVPARISTAKAKEVKETAKRIYQALGCSGFARVDMFLTPFGEIVFNEVNTIPGFTEHSRYPGMMKAAGHSFSEILENIIEQAVRS
jgi:D-alanine---D-serine ligase